MKIRELLEDREDDSNKMPHLFLDMDGVQADFFGKWADEHGVKNYKDIPNRESTIDELAHSSAERVYKFFKDLLPLPGGQKIVSWLKTNNIPYTVLSAPLRGPYAGASIEAKKHWLDQYNPGTSNTAIFTGAKYKHAKDGGRANVLVDDFGKYLDAWSNTGGIAVKHSDETADQTIQELEKIYAPYLNKNENMRMGASNEPLEEDGKGLYANIHAKQERIQRGSNERMRKPGTPGAPTAGDFKNASKTAKKN